MDKLTLIVKALDDMQLEDIVIYDMREVNPFFDYFILSSAKNPRQLNGAIRDVKETLLENDHDRPNIEGSTGGAWALIDCGDIIVNVFTKDEREYYNIEKMWIDVPKIDKDTLL